MDLYLIRHGACCDSTAEFYDDEKRTMNPPLTEKGVEQAQKLAERCKGIGLNAVYSSDLLRALQTSQIIASTVKCGLSVSPALREIDMGDIYKKSWDHYPELFAKWVLHREDIPIRTARTERTFGNGAARCCCRLCKSRMRKLRSWHMAEPSGPSSAALSK
jgi:probable phosphoglycerate mutase